MWNPQDVIESAVGSLDRLRPADVQALAEQCGPRWAEMVIWLTKQLPDMPKALKQAIEDAMPHVAR